eukprot:6454508-Alexandrium_andersonii.AAC.1
MDDRSIRAPLALPDTPPEVASAPLDLALQHTVGFDEAVGFRENAGKRQRWAPEETVEHLGLRMVADLPSAASVAALAPEPPPAPKNGREPLFALCGALETLPGYQAGRVRMAHAYVASRWLWAAPMLSPPASLGAPLFHAVTGSRLTWFCIGRFFASHIMLHPVLGSA